MMHKLSAAAVCGAIAFVCSGVRAQEGAGASNLVEEVRKSVSVSAFAEIFFKNV